MSQELMKQLQQVVKEKMDDCSITNLADVLMAYNLVSEDLMDCPKQLFKGKIEKTVVEKVMLKEYFNALSATKIAWTLAKVTNKDLSPAFS